MAPGRVPPGHRRLVPVFCQERFRSSLAWFEDPWITTSTPYVQACLGNIGIGFAHILTLF